VEEFAPGGGSLNRPSGWEVHAVVHFDIIFYAWSSGPHDGKRAPWGFDIAPADSVALMAMVLFYTL